MYVLQESPDGIVVMSNGAEVRPLATLKSEYGGVSHIIKDDHCFVLVNFGIDKEFHSVEHWYPEAVDALMTLLPGYQNLKTVEKPEGNGIAFSAALALESVPDELHKELSNGCPSSALVKFARTVAYKVFHNLKHGHLMDPDDDPVMVDGKSASEVWASHYAPTPVIDRKFIFTAVNPVNGNFYTHKDAVVLCAKDACTVAAIEEGYLPKARELGAGPAHIMSIELLIERLKYYRDNVECRVPDTVGDEVDRCVKGEGLD